MTRNGQEEPCDEPNGGNEDQQLGLTVTPSSTQYATGTGPPTAAYGHADSPKGLEKLLSQEYMAPVAWT